MKRVPMVVGSKHKREVEIHATCRVCVTMQRMNVDASQEVGLVVGLLLRKSNEFINVLFDECCAKHKKLITIWKKKTEGSVHWW